MTKYKYTAAEGQKIKMHGIDLTVFGENVPEANVCYVSVKKGHFQEFYDVKSYYIYYIIKGKGTFFLSDEKVEAKATDLIVIPVNTRILITKIDNMLSSGGYIKNLRSKIYLDFLKQE